MDLFDKEREDSHRLLAFLYKKRVAIVVGIFLGLLAGISLYVSMPKKYRSTAIVYPVNSFTRDQILSNPQFGHELESEHLMQLLESRSIRDSVINKFDLVQYYQIDQSQKDWNEKLTLHFIGDVKFFRSKYLSIVISAEMKDPELAAQVVNYIVEVVNDFRKEIFKENMQSELDYLAMTMNDYDKERDSIKNVIYAMDGAKENNFIIENYLLMSGKENYVANKFVSTPEAAELIEQYKSIDQEYRDAKLKYSDAKEMARRPLLDNYVIDTAYPTFKPVSPSLIGTIIAGLLFGLFLSLGVSFIVNTIKTIQKNFAK